MVIVANFTQSLYTPHFNNIFTKLTHTIAPRNVLMQIQENGVNELHFQDNAICFKFNKEPVPWY